MVDERSAPRGLEQRDRVAEFVGSADGLNSRFESVQVEAGETRQSGGAFVG